MRKIKFYLKRKLSFLSINFLLIFLVNSLEANTQKYQTQFEEIALEIWNYAELGYKEYKSSELLQKSLEKEGFLIRK